jgi:predicted  nucleic acid-binding Zn-ribbon protein
MYSKQIEQLNRLQQLDEQIMARERELTLAPKELADLEAKRGELTSRQAQIQEKIDLLREQNKRLSNEIEDDGSKIKKSKNKLMMSSNAREYHAMMREMDNMEKVNRLREEENIAIMEELSRQNEALEALSAEATTMDAELAAKKAGLEARLTEASAGLADLKRQRTDAGKQVPPPILSRYEFIRSRLKAPVIVAVTTGICGGCHIAIPPQTYNELQRGKQIHSCPNCQRLIFWSEHVQAPKTEAVESA